MSVNNGALPSERERQIARAEENFYRGIRALSDETDAFWERKARERAERMRQARAVAQKAKPPKTVQEDRRARLKQ